jgi:hypothetical protein
LGDPNRPLPPLFNKQNNFIQKVIFFIIFFFSFSIKLVCLLKKEEGAS